MSELDKFQDTMLASQRLADREPSAAVTRESRAFSMSSRGDPSIGQKDTGAEARGKGRTHTLQKTMLNINIRSFENPGKSSLENDFA